MQNLATALTEAISHQQPARDADAAAANREMLFEHPSDPSATYLYGLLQLDTGRPMQGAQPGARSRRAPRISMRGWTLAACCCPTIAPPRP
jgi:hypothetical protein